MYMCLYVCIRIYMLSLPAHFSSSVLIHFDADGSTRTTASLRPAPGPRDEGAAAAVVPEARFCETLRGRLVSLQSAITVWFS